VVRAGHIHPRGRHSYPNIMNRSMPFLTASSVGFDDDDEDDSIDEFGGQELGQY